MNNNFYIHDRESKGRNTLIIVSLVILFICLLFGLYTNPNNFKFFENNKTINTTIKEITTETKTITTPKIEVIKPILKSIETVSIHKNINNYALII